MSVRADASGGGDWVGVRPWQAVVIRSRATWGGPQDSLEQQRGLFADAAALVFGTVGELVEGQLVEADDETVMHRVAFLGGG